MGESPAMSRHSARRRGRRDARRAWELSLPFSPPMAVPKQKQSHSRTNKRRSTHKISAPTINACPQCRQPRLPHRVCGNCGFYAGREVVHVHGGDHDHEH